LQQNQIINKRVIGRALAASCRGCTIASRAQQAHRARNAEPFSIPKKRPSEAVVAVGRQVVTDFRAGLCESGSLRSSEAWVVRRNVLLLRSNPGSQTPALIFH
jgi:hypothetical protein